MTERRTTLELLTQYAAYHRDQRNIVTHFIGVPMIVFGVGVLLARPHIEVAGWELTAAAMAWVLSALWYLSRRGAPGLSVATSLSVGALVALAHGVSGGSTANWLVWGVGSFVVGWVIQFLGHYYEGKKPAFADDVIGLLVGPMFVTAEAMFMLGWNPKLLREIERRVGPTYLRDLAHPGPA
jgi:uncharacterized membrane protein YGL010W